MGGQQRRWASHSSEENMWFKCPYCGDLLRGNFEAQLHTQVAPKMCGYRARRILGSEKEN